MTTFSFLLGVAVSLMGGVQRSLLVGVAVGMMGGALGAEWWTSRGEFCLDKCTAKNYIFWCYTVDPEDTSKTYKSTGHPDLFQYDKHNVLVDIHKRWDYCTPQNSLSSQTSLWPITQCSDKCSTVGGRSICDSRSYQGSSKLRNTVNLLSYGDGGKYHEKRMGTYLKTNLTDPIKGYPVYQLGHKVNNKVQYLFAHYIDKSWRVGPDFRSGKGAQLKSIKHKLSPTPHEDDWQFQFQGTWVKIKSVPVRVDRMPIHNATLDNRSWVNRIRAYGKSVNGIVVNGTIVNGTVVNVTIVNGTVVNGTIVNGTVVYGKMVNGTVVNGTIVNGTIVDGKIANGKIVNGKIVNGTVVKVKQRALSHRDRRRFQRNEPSQNETWINKNGTWIKQRSMPQENWPLNNGTWINQNGKTKFPQSRSWVKRSSSSQSEPPQRDGWLFKENKTWITDDGMKAIFNVAPRGMVNITSTGNANKYQKSRMGTYTQLNFLINGYPVYRQTDRSNEVQFMFVDKDDTWRVGPDVYTWKGTGLKNTNKGSPEPPRKGWMYRREGEWREDSRTTARIRMEIRDWFYCSQEKPLIREQVSAVLRLWCIGECTRIDGDEDFTCPTMFGRDKCSPEAGLNVKGEECITDCRKDEDNYKCYMDRQWSRYVYPSNSTKHQQLSNSSDIDQILPTDIDPVNSTDTDQLNSTNIEKERTWFYTDQKFCGNHEVDITQKQSLKFVDGKLCAGLCEFPNPEEKAYKECQVVSWENNRHKSELRLKTVICWGSRPIPTTTIEMSLDFMTVLGIGLFLFICCGCCAAVMNAAKEDDKKKKKSKMEDTNST